MPKFIQVELFEDGKARGGYTNRPEDISIADIFDGATEGEQYLLTCVELSEEEYAVFPEFTGF